MTKYGVSHRSVQPSSSGRKAPKVLKSFLAESCGFQPGKGAPSHRGRARLTLMDDLCELDQQSAKAKEHHGAQRAACSLMGAMSG